MSYCKCSRSNNPGFMTCCSACSKGCGKHTSDCHERNGLCRCGRIRETGKQKCCQYCDGKLGCLNHSNNCHLNHSFCIKPNCLKMARSSLEHTARIKYDCCTTCGTSYI